MPAKKTAKKTTRKIIKKKSDSMELKIKKLHEDAVVPKFARPGDAAMDLYSTEELIILPKHRAAIKTGLAIEFPKNHVFLIWDKSGLALDGLTTMAGVIDSQYRGEIKVVLLNVSSEPQKIEKGQKIAQAVLQPIIVPEISVVDELSDTKRGKGGFGSTGKF
jgi:dUTP pyrophosphatase